MSTLHRIHSVFNAEFHIIAHKFVVLEVELSSLLSSKADFIYHPGVYVHYNKAEIIKVGRHLTNSRKRAYEHVQDGTQFEGFSMSSLKEDESAGVVLINVVDPADYHWVAAVELFLEKALQPRIKSKRS